MSSPNVLISGSGIAGSAFAFWLLRAYPNARITVVERDPAPRLTGASIDIRDAAVDIIKWMGVEQQIRDQSTREEGVQFVQKDGTPVATFMATGQTDVQSFTSEYEIFRGGLAKIFIDSIKEKVKLVFNETVESYEQRDDGVAVTFAKSKEVKTYDLLVAADGLRSKIRATMLNAAPEEHIHDMGMHIAYFTVKKDLLQGGRLAKWYNDTNGRAVFVRPDPDPAGQTRCNFINVTAKGDAEAKKRLDDTLLEGNESYMKHLEESFSDVGWITPEILKGMRESDDFYCSIFGQVKSPRLQDGRVVLLGDAGFATPGIGTSLAIIGSYILAGELLSHAGDVIAASKRYDEVMLSIVKSQQASSWNIIPQLLNPQTQWGVDIRNYVIGFVSWMKLDKLGVMVASKLGFSEKKASLPSYPWSGSQDLQT